ncbi:MAG: antitoxin VapB family protein [Candidatus Thorarchaeota archaeon]
MTTKTISIAQEVYDLLEKLKLPGERLDDTILRLCGIKPRGNNFDKRFDEALGKILKEDVELLERLAH